MNDTPVTGWKHYITNQAISIKSVWNFRDFILATTTDDGLPTDSYSEIAEGSWHFNGTGLISSAILPANDSWTSAGANDSGDSTLSDPPIDPPKVDGPYANDVLLTESWS
jgi:hypothetical protein